MPVATEDLNIHSPSDLAPAPPSTRTVPQPRELAGEFDYKPVTPLAPLALFVGICSVASLLWIGALVLAVAGIVLGLWCVRRVRASEGEFTGGTLGMAGAGLSAMMLVLGSGYHAYSYATEVPEGHQRVSFNWLSSQQPIIAGGMVDFEPEVKALNGQKVFIKGYQLNTRQGEGLSEFVLCKDTGDCCFGGNPKPTDMIQVKMQNGMVVPFREMLLVGVAGTLRVRADIHDGKIASLYTLEATHFQ